MNRVWPYILGAVLVAGAAAVIILVALNVKDSDHDNPQSATQSQPPAPKQACGIFTLTDAKVVLGDTAKGGTNPKTTSSPDVLVTTCTYTQDTGSNAPTTPVKSASLLARVPKTAAAAALNRDQFGRYRPTDVQPVNSYGSSAYWDAENGRLNILKNNVWYIVTNGPPAAADRTLDQAEQLADLLIKKM